MSETPRPLAELLRRVEQVGEEVAQLRRALSRRDRLLTGLAYALRAVAAAALGYYGALAVGLTQGFWAAITAISVTQASYAEVSHSSRDQSSGRSSAVWSGSPPRRWCTTSFPPTRWPWWSA